MDPGEIGINYTMDDSGILLDNEKRTAKNIIERYSLRRLPDYIADKSFLCLRCLSEGSFGTLMYVEGFCEQCLTDFRKIGFLDTDNMSYEAIRIENANAFSLNVGADILMNLMIRFNWQPVVYDQNIPLVSSLILKLIEDYFRKLDPEKKETVGWLYKQCTTNDSIGTIAKYYVNLYNLACSSKEENLKLIDCISVRGLFGYHNYDLKMHDGLSVVIGTNGLGKTTIFQILKAILIEGNDFYESYKKLEYILSVPFDELVVVFRDGTRLELCQKVDSLNEKVLSFKLNDSEYSVFKTDKRFKKILKDLNPESELELIGIDGGQFLSLLGEINNIYSAIRRSFPKLKTLKKRFLFIETKRIKLTEFKQSIARLKKNGATARKIERLSNLFSNLYYEADPSLKRIRLDEKNRLVLETSQHNLIDFDCLSSGEKGALLILYQILFNAETNSIILIDEPEISLHIAWQQRLGEIIQDMLKEKNGTQIIVATHSPFMAASNQDSIVEARLAQ